MSVTNKSSLFKSVPTQARGSKADATTTAARAFLATEARARDAKTARLKELRLAKEAADAAEKEAAALAPKKRKTTKKVSE